MKTCKGCGVAKDLSMFGRNANTSDGRLGRCKTCHSAQMKALRQSRSAEWLATRRKRYEKTKEQRAIHQRTTRIRNPGKNAARQAVHRALKSGRLVRGCCEVCASSDTQAHHDDYSQPLRVRWFCHAHHMEKHYGN